MILCLVVLATILIGSGNVVAESDCSRFPIGSLPWTECRYMELSRSQTPPPPSTPVKPPVRRELNRSVGSPEWFHCQKELQAQIPPTAKPTTVAYSYMPAPGYYQYTVYSVADPPPNCVIYMRPDPASAIADWKALPADRCKHAIWSEPTPRHPDVILPGGIPWYVPPRQ
jgi:hypothetical protein